MKNNALSHQIITDTLNLAQRLVYFAEGPKGLPEVFSAKEKQELTGEKDLTPQKATKFLQKKLKQIQSIFKKLIEGAKKDNDTTKEHIYTHYSEMIPKLFKQAITEINKVKTYKNQERKLIVESVIKEYEALLGSKENQITRDFEYFKQDNLAKAEEFHKHIERIEMAKIKTQFPGLNIDFAAAKKDFLETALKTNRGETDASIQKWKETIAKAWNESANREIRLALIATGENLIDPNSRLTNEQYAETYQKVRPEKKKMEKSLNDLFSIHKTLKYHNITFANCDTNLQALRQIHQKPISINELPKKTTEFQNKQREVLAIFKPAIQKYLETTFSKTQTSLSRHENLRQLGSLLNIVQNELNDATTPAKLAAVFQKLLGFPKSAKEYFDNKSRKQQEIKKMENHARQQLAHWKNVKTNLNQFTSALSDNEKQKLDKALTELTRENPQFLIETYATEYKKAETLACRLYRKAFYDYAYQRMSDKLKILNADKTGLHLDLHKRAWNAQHDTASINPEGKTKNGKEYTFRSNYEQLYKKFQTKYPATTPQGLQRMLSAYKTEFAQNLQQLLKDQTPDLLQKRQPIQHLVKKQTNIKKDPKTNSVEVSFKNNEALRRVRIHDCLNPSATDRGKEVIAYEVDATTGTKTEVARGIYCKVTKTRGQKPGDPALNQMTVLLSSDQKNLPKGKKRGPGYRMLALQPSKGKKLVYEVSQNTNIKMADALEKNKPGTPALATALNQQKETAIGTIQKSESSSAVA